MLLRLFFNYLTAKVFAKVFGDFLRNFKDKTNQIADNKLFLGHPIFRKTFLYGSVAGIVKRFG